MKFNRWQSAAFVCWAVLSCIILDEAMRGLSMDDTAKGIWSMAVIFGWCALSLATDCFTFKSRKNKEE